MNGEKYQAYLASYKANLPFTHVDHEAFEIHGISVTVDAYEYNDANNHREVAHLLLEKADYRYEFDCVDRHHWDFYPVTLDGRSYLLICKSLYGFTLLDPTTLNEVYDYFPEKVLENEESFIITGAQTFGKYLIFDGCYWGSSYEFCAYHHATKRFVSLTQIYGITAGDQSAEVVGENLILKGNDIEHWNPTEISIIEADIDRLMDERGTTDF